MTSNQEQSIRVLRFKDAAEHQPVYLDDKPNGGYMLSPAVHFNAPVYETKELASAWAYGFIAGLASPDSLSDFLERIHASEGDK